MKIAIVHDHFLFLGGAERVLTTLLKIYPNSDVFLAFTSKVQLKKLRKLTTGRIILSPLNSFLLNPNMADYFKPVLFFWWESLNFNDYDLVISSSHSFSSKSIRPPKSTSHISYIHTSPRYLWEEFNETDWIRKQPFKFLLTPFLRLLRKMDQNGARRPDILVANSRIVQKRIKKYYYRDSTVIYPPVDIPPKISTKLKKRYYLCVSRLVKQKGVEIAIKACNLLQKSLVIVGTGSQENYLKSISGPTIKFLGNISDNKLNTVYSRAKALLYPSYQEDFGIAPVEAMARGIPVIACKDGGVAESVIDGKTGILLNDHSVSSLVSAINKIESVNISPKKCRDRARKFSEDVFISRIKSIISKIFKENLKQTRVNILGVKMEVTNYQDILGLISKNILKQKKTYIFPSTVASIMAYKQDNNFLAQINKNSIVVADGMPLVWLGRFYGYKKMRRVYGPTLMRKMLKLGALKKYRFYLFAGKNGQSKRLKEKIRQSYPGISIVGVSDAPTRPVNASLNKRVIKSINQKRVDIVFVGLGSPHQERWILDNADKVKASILIGVGAAFDFLSGEVKQAPFWVQQSGLEWLFRFSQEPTRLWHRYTITNLKFITAVFKETIRRV